MSNVSWTRDQLRAIETRGSSVLVSAAAGSGKTAVLVERLMREIAEEGRDITDFLIITYTKAAAGELKRKICDALYERASQKVNDRHIRRQLALIESANISTVHSFCSRLIKNYGNNPSLAGGFRVLDESEASIIASETLSEMMTEKYEKGDREFLELAEFMSSSKSDRPFFNAVLELFDKSRSHPYPSRWLRRIADTYRFADDGDAEDVVWGKLLLEEAHETVRNCISAEEEVLAGIAGNPELNDTYADFLAEEIHNLENLIDPTWDGMYSTLSEFKFATIPSSRKITDKDGAKRVKTVRDRVKSSISSLGEKVITAPSDELIAELCALAPIIGGLCALADELSERYLAEKHRRSVLDYSDLEHEAIDILVESYDEETDTVVPTETAREASKNFCEILLDEFQDSNCVQDVIFRALSRDGNNIIMVGDVKQSIYKFRLADPTIFMKKYKTFAPYEKARGSEPRRISLSKNFRSGREVLNASNALFSYLMTEKLGGIDYTEDEYLIARDDAPAETEENAAEFILVDAGEYSKPEAEAVFIAEKIASLIADGFEITQKDGTKRAVRQGDFAILLRSKSYAAVYERELSVRGIAHTSPAVINLLDRPEVSYIISLLQAIDNPTLDIPLVSAVTSPLFGFDSDDLCEIRRGGNREFIYAMQKMTTLSGKTAEKCKKFLSFLSEMRILARSLSADRLVWELYNRTGALGIFGSLQNGRDCQNNLIAFYKFISSSEQLGYRGLYRVLGHLLGIIERGGEIPSPSSYSDDAVTIMSIHKSKGLEFPVVFAAQALHNFNMDDIKKNVLVHPKLGIGLKYHNEENTYFCSTLARDAISREILREMRSEEMRILYVALTRARDKLFIVGAGKNTARTLEKILSEYPYPKERRACIDGRNGTDLWFLIPVLFSSSGAPLAEYADMIPQSGESLGGLKSVAAGLAEAHESEENEKAAPKTASDIPDAERVRDLLSFKYGNIESTLIPSKVTATGLAHSEEAIVRKRLSRRPLREGLTASERGTALHMAMQFSVFSECKTKYGAERELERLVRGKYLTREQADAVNPQALCDFVNSEIGRSAESADYLRREFKFSVLLPADEIAETPSLAGDEVLLQGVIDMFFENDGKLTIVDFKSDRKRPEGETLEKYSYQLRTYRRALFEIYGKRADRLILFLAARNEYIEVE